MKRLFFIFLIIVGCISSHPHVTTQTQAKLNALRGQHKQEVLLSYGPAEEKTSDESGGEIWIYYFHVERSSYATSQAAIAGKGSTKKMMFFINPSDTVYHWAVTGQDTPTDRTKVVY